MSAPHLAVEVFDYLRAVTEREPVWTTSHDGEPMIVLAGSDGSDTDAIYVLGMTLGQVVTVADRWIVERGGESITSRDGSLDSLRWAIFEVSEMVEQGAL